MTVYKKTWKREIATLQLLLHSLMVLFICWIAYSVPERDLADLVSLAIGLAVWVYSFAGAAFGIDAWAKQIQGQN